MCRLQGVEFNAQCVVFGVGDRWGILDVVATICIGNGRNEFAVAGGWSESLAAHPCTSRLAMLAASVFTPDPAKAIVTSSSWRVSFDVTTIPSPNEAWRTRSPSRK